MLSDALGPAQVAALLVLTQRALEEAYSQYNSRHLLLQGAREEGRDFYPVVAATHLCWIAGLALLVPVNTPLNLPPILAFLALQPLRYWIIGSLGRFWTHRVISLAGAPIVTRGPYRVMRHPNYALTVAESFLLPLAFGQLALAIIFTSLWIVVLRYKIRIEDGALEQRRLRTAASV